MAFEHFMTDTITLLKRNGAKSEDIKAGVQKNKIFISNAESLIEPGDLVQRKMSNGAEETYEVIDPGFHESFNSIPTHYQMDVRKPGLPEAKSAIQNITYNVTGHNARINQNSVDQSVNIIRLNPDIAENLNALKQELNLIIQDEVERKAATRLLMRSKTSSSPSNRSGLSSPHCSAACRQQET